MKALSALALFILLPVAALADPRQDLIDGMAKCAGVNDGAQRLACYDALNPSLKAAQSEPPPPAAAAPAAPPAMTAAAPPPADNRSWYDPSRIFGVSPNAQTTPQQFGSENLAAPAPKPGEVAAPQALDSITANVSDYSFNSSGHFILVLENGQIWRQLQGDTDRAHFDKHGTNTVTISRGMIGSYNLTIGDSVKTFKVERLK